MQTAKFIGGPLHNRVMPVLGYKGIVFPIFYNNRMPGYGKVSNPLNFVFGFATVTYTRTNFLLRGQLIYRFTSGYYDAREPYHAISLQKLESQIRDLAKGQK